MAETIDPTFCRGPSLVLKWAINSSGNGTVMARQINASVFSEVLLCCVWLSHLQEEQALLYIDTLSSRHSIVPSTTLRAFPPHGYASV